MNNLPLQPQDVVVAFKSSGVKAGSGDSSFYRSGCRVVPTWPFPEKAFTLSGSSLSVSKETRAARLVSFQPCKGRYRKRSLKRGGCRVKTDPLKEAGFRSRQATGVRATTLRLADIQVCRSPVKTSILRQLYTDGCARNRLTIYGLVCSPPALHYRIGGKTKRVSRP